MSFRSAHMAATGVSLGGTLGKLLQVADDDAASEHCDDGASSGSSEYDPAAAFVTNIDEITEPLARKRKPFESNDSAECNIAKKARLAEDAKNGFGSTSRPRLDMTRQLPAEIWHHIFTFLPPRTLGTLLRVNKLFQSYLDPSSDVKIPPPVFSAPATLSVLKPDAIWQASRRLFWPRMPAPLKYRSEVDMWRLACSRTCQFCSRLSSDETGEAQSQWHSGPGTNGVSPVFPFFIVSCGKCLQERSVKEIDLVLSSTPLVLLSGLPMVFLTPELHVIPPQVIRSAPALPENPIPKVYWPGQIEDIKVELEAVRNLGPAATEEWIKGLEARGKGTLADASRWEKWYLSGGVRQMRMHLPAASPHPADTVMTSSTVPSNTQVSKSVVNKSKSGSKCQGEAERAVISGELPKSLSETSSIPPKPPTRLQGQQKRTKEEAAELKAKRRAEIERRASQLDPPIIPSVLVHIPSFQAALQIIAPFDDNAWELLKPRLLAQREEAEQREKDGMANANDTQERRDIPPHDGTGNSQPKEASDEEWNEAQGPLRALISGFADDIIRSSWGGGKSVKRKNCTRFATDVLLYVRKKFYARVAKDVADAHTAGLNPIFDPPEGPWTQKLTLENMKWIFDVKVRPLTDCHRKDLFFCSGCVGNRKSYGFEAAIQHYAAKHTNALSKGNVVVHWRAEWPEKPIFGPETKHPVQTSQVVEEFQPMPPMGALLHNGQATASNYAPYATADQQRSSMSLPLNTVPTMHPAGVAPLMPYRGPDTSQMYQPMVAAIHPQNEHDDSPHEPKEGLDDLGAMSSEMYPPHFRPQNKPRGGYRGAPPGDPYRLRVDFMAKIVKRTWGMISNVKNVPISVKICVVIRHIAKDYQQHYSEPAPFEMFIDGLQCHKDFSPLHNVCGLACKSCMSSPTWPQGRRPFSFPALVDHFYDSHGRRLIRQVAPPEDWRVDMVWLPDLPVLAGLGKILRNKKPTLRLVADALSWALQAGGRGGQNKSVTKEPAAGAPNTTDLDSRAKNTSPATVAAPAPAGHRNLPDAATSPIQDIPNLQPASVVYGRPNDTHRRVANNAGGSGNTGAHGVPERELDLQATPGTMGRRYTSDKQNGPAASNNDGSSGLPVQIITDNLDGRASRLISRDSYPQNGFGPAERMNDLQNSRGVRVITHIPPSLEGVRESEYRPSRVEYVNSHGFRPESRQRSASPQPPFRYPQPAYRERNPRPVHPPTPYQYETRPYSRYTNEPPPHPVPPFETYEIVEVRDPQGDYFIRRPIRYDEPQVFAYTERARDAPWYPRYATSYDHRLERQSSMQIENPPPAAGSPEYEDYDPRYPAAAGN